jgi:hypothetical protein
VRRLCILEQGRFWCRVRISLAPPSGWASAIELGRPAPNPQQTETFLLNDCARDCQRDGNLPLETTFFSKASYFAVLVQF